MASVRENQLEQPPDQYAALPWLGRDDARRYLLVTSRRTGRWIFPKGSAEESEAPWEAALREAGEEAGVGGRAAAHPVGRYRSLKISSQATRLLTVELWPVEIRCLADAYPDAERRMRRLVGIEEARRLLVQADMLALLERFHAASSG